MKLVLKSAMVGVALCGMAWMQAAMAEEAVTPAATPAAPAEAVAPAAKPSEQVPLIVELTGKIAVVTNEQGAVTSATITVAGEVPTTVSIKLDMVGKRVASIGAGKSMKLTGTMSDGETPKTLKVQKYSFVAEPVPSAPSAVVEATIPETPAESGAAAVVAPAVEAQPPAAGAAPAQE